MDLLNTTYLSDILHLISQALLVPVIVLLIAGICYALFSIGSIVAEALTTRRSFSIDMPEFLAALASSKISQLPSVVANSGLLNRQKIALLTLWDYRILSEEAHTALAKRLLENENLRYDRISGRTDTMSKLTPMLGLMGTLIPLGPGIVALGQKQLDVLSASIGVAFDTTVAGLIAAFVCFIVSKIRKNWYRNYMVALESSMVSVIDKVNSLRQVGELGCSEPGHTAKDYAQAVGSRHVKDESRARQIADAEAEKASQAERVMDEPDHANAASVAKAERPRAEEEKSGGGS